MRRSLRFISMPARLALLADAGVAAAGGLLRGCAAATILLTVLCKEEGRCMPSLPARLPLASAYHMPSLAAVQVIAFMAGHG